MNMIIGGATVALVESKRGGMDCGAYPSRMAMVLEVLNNGAIGGDGGWGSDGHKAALAEVAERIAAIQASIVAQEKRDAYIESVREPWIKQAAARYVERGGFDEHEARNTAASLFSLIANDGSGEMPDAVESADEDMKTWGD